jgi:hypothetical protein
MRTFLVKPHTWFPHIRPLRMAAACTNEPARRRYRQRRDSGNRHAGATRHLFNKLLGQLYLRPAKQADLRRCLTGPKVPVILTNVIRDHPELVAVFGGRSEIGIELALRLAAGQRSCWPRVVRGSSTTRFKHSAMLVPPRCTQRRSRPTTSHPTPACSKRGRARLIA